MRAGSKNRTENIWKLTKKCLNLKLIHTHIKHRL